MILSAKQATNSHRRLVHSNKVVYITLPYKSTVRPVLRFHRWDK